MTTSNGAGALTALGDGAPAVTPLPPDLAAGAAEFAAADAQLDAQLVERIAQSLLGGLAPGDVPALLGVLPAPPPAAAAGLAVPSEMPFSLGLPFGADSLNAGLPSLLAPALAVTAAPSEVGYYFLAPPSAPVTPALPTSRPSQRLFDVADVRKDFPILAERIHGKPLVWLDNAATTHKPRAVIERVSHYYAHEYSNVHRGAHTLAARSTEAYEDAREKVARFIGAGSAREIVFVRGTTEAINLVANTFGRLCLGRGDEIVLTTLEHHSNIVPWQFLAQAVGAKIRVVPITERGEVMLGEYGKLLGPRTRLVAITQVSNALGTVVPVREMTAMAHRFDARVLIDGAQAVSHFPVNVQELDADFYVLSGHKMFAPSGIGVLYGKKALLDQMPPWQGGGNMIERVTFEESTFADPPMRFEAGTGTLAPAVGLGAAVDYLERLGMANVARHEHELLAHATEALRAIPGLRLIGTAPEKAGVLSFLLDGHEPVAVGKALDQEGIAVRAGHHCAQPALAHYGLSATVRPSLALYNTHEEMSTWRAPSTGWRATESMTQAESRPPVAQASAEIAAEVARQLAPLRAELERSLSDLRERVPQDKASLVVFSGDLDRVLAAFVIATGAAAAGLETSLFFTFWGLSAVKDKAAKAASKGFKQRMFGAMTAANSEGLGTSKLNFLGLGSVMLRSMMKEQGIASLEELMALAREMGVKMTACTMSMDAMGVAKEELVAGLEYAGVAAFMADASRSRVCLFI